MDIDHPRWSEYAIGLRARWGDFLGTRRTLVETSLHGGDRAKS